MKKHGGAKRGRGRPRGKKAPPPVDLDESEVMTLQEVADYLHCHYVTVLTDLIRATGLPAFRLSGNWRFLKSEVEKWIAAGGGKPSGTAPAKTHGGRRGPKPKPKTTRR